MAKSRPTFQNIRPIDLKDPTLSVLNGDLQSIITQLSSLGASGGTGWNTFAPVVSGNLGLQAVLVSSTRGEYLQETNKTTIELDMNIMLSGSAGPTIVVNVPVPLVGAGLMSLSGIGYYDPTHVFALNVSLSNANMSVMRYDFSNFTLGAVEIVVSGTYHS